MLIQILSRRNNLILLFLVLILFSLFANSLESGVIFYAGFEGKADATFSAGDGKASCRDGAPEFTKGKRGKALLSGDGEGYLEYKAKGNILPEQGTVEFWVCPQDWESTDKNFHVFFDALVPGWLVVYVHKNTQLLFLTDKDRSEPGNTDIVASGVTLKKGKWYHLAVTWNKDEICIYVNGQRKGCYKDPQIPKRLSIFRFGDRSWGFKRHASSLLDELYIYDRALTEKEILWAYKHAMDRKAGKDLPIEQFPQAKRSFLSLTKKKVDYQYKRGNVLFYAGYNNNFDSEVGSNGISKAIDGGGSLTADGFGYRGRALRTGDGEGFRKYSAKGNINPREGSVEFWVKPVDWDCSDKKTHYFFRAKGPGGEISFREASSSVFWFTIRSTGVKDPLNWDAKVQGMAQRAYGSSFRKGKWIHFVLTWKKGAPIGFFFNGNDRSVPSLVPSLGKLVSIEIGDFGGEKNRNAHSLIDEVYIYNRALTPEEVTWAYKHALDRKPGMDIPRNFGQPTLEIVPQPSKHTILVRLDTHSRTSDFTGVARIEPANGTKPALVKPIGERYGEARIPFKNLAPGKYKVHVNVYDSKGKETGALEKMLIVPAPSSLWLGNKIGISNTPPKPWLPIKASSSSMQCWGRKYKFGMMGLPSAITDQGKELLASSVRLILSQNGKTVSWRESYRKVVKKTAAEIDITGKASSNAGDIKWRCRGEFDGMIRYDFEMPAGTAGDSLRLIIPVKKPYDTLHYTYDTDRGALPKNNGLIWKSPWVRYKWIGNENIGLCVFQETNEGWIDTDNPEGIALVRNETGLDIIYNFTSKPFKLTKPWKFTFGLQATPVKPRPKNWRLLLTGIGNNRSTIKIPWPTPSIQKYFSMPSPLHPKSWKAKIARWHKEGKIVVPYSMLNYCTPEMPEYTWFKKQWARRPNPRAGGAFGPGWTTYAAVRLVPSWIDFAVWKNYQLARKYDYDGIYVDFAGARGSLFAPEYGAGYVRDGKEHAAWPLFASREIWKRTYTMFKKIKPNGLIICHVSAAVHVPVLSFCDIWVDGEGNWRGALEDNYLDVLPLDVWRAEYMAHQGGVPWFLPLWYGAFKQGRRGVYVTKEQTRNCFGLALLHDTNLWPHNGVNRPDIVKEFYDVLFSFGWADAKFFGYWNNQDLINVQNKAIKASIYKKPQSGALIEIYNTTRQIQNTALTVEWEKLQSKKPLTVIDAYTRKPIQVKRKELNIRVPPIAYRLLWVR